MEDSGLWNALKNIACIFFLALIGLYAIHCVTTRQLISVDEFDAFVRKVIQNIFSR